MIRFGNTSKLDYFRELQSLWSSKNQRETALMEQNMQQYLGSKEIDGAPEAPAEIVRNITYELIESQMSTTIPAPRVTPKRWSEGHGRCARRIKLLLEGVRDELPFEKMNDTEERLVPIHGASARVIDWDDSYKTHDTVGRASVKVLNMTYLTWQPGIYEIQDMDAIFVRDDTTRDDILQRYDVEWHDVEEAEAAPEAPDPDETVSVYTAWYRNEDGQVCKFVWSGGVVLEDVENYWARKKYVCKVCGERRELSEGEDGKCRCGGEFEVMDDEYEELDRDIVLSDGRIIPAQSPVYENGRIKREDVEVPLEQDGAPVVDAQGVPIMTMQSVPVMAPTRLPWYLPDIYPVTIRKNTSRDGVLLGQSDCEFIRDQQQQINKLETNIHQKSMGAGVYPYMPENVSLALDKTINQVVARLPEGVRAQQCGVLDFSVNTMHDQALSDRAREQAKATLGITASYQGQEDTTAKSGIAKQVQVQQAAGRLASKRVMKQAAYAEADEAIFKLNLAYADEPRPVSYVDEFGQVHYEAFNRYDYYEYDKKTGEWYVDDGYTFSCDATQGLETQSEARWQMIAADYQAGMYGDPASVSAKLAAWMARERAGYPDAHVQVEHFRELYRAEQQAIQAMQQQQQNMAAQGAQEVV